MTISGFGVILALYEKNYGHKMSGKEMTMKKNLCLSFEHTYCRSYETLDEEQGLIAMSSYKEERREKLS